MTLRLALIDGALPTGHAAVERVEVLRGGPADSPADSPAGRHALALAEAALSHAPALRLASLVVFDGRLVTDAETVARALDAARGADVVLCAFGLPRDDPGIREAADALSAGGAVIVAAAPARGGPVYPAALPGVIAVQGDARCAAADWSALAPGRFGGCPVAGDPAEPVGGASAAAAHLAGHIAALLAGGQDPATIRAALESRARFRGRERRTA